MKTSHDSQEEKYTSAQLDNFFNKRKGAIDEELKSREKISVGKYKEISEILNKHLENNVIIYQNDQFTIEKHGSNTTTATTVTYKDNTSNDTRFVRKKQETTCETT